MGSLFRKRPARPPASTKWNVDLLNSYKATFNFLVGDLADGGSQCSQLPGFIFLRATEVFRPKSQSIERSDGKLSEKVIAAKFLNVTTAGETIESNVQAPPPLDESETKILRNAVDSLEELPKDIRGAISLFRLMCSFAPVRQLQKSALTSGQADPSLLMAAETHLEFALRAFPDNVMALSDLALILPMTNEPEKFEGCWQRVVELCQRAKSLDPSCVEAAKLLESANAIIENDTFHLLRGEEE